MINYTNKQPAAAFLSLLLIAGCMGVGSCSLQNKINTSAKENMLNAPELKSAHFGISIYEPATGKNWYTYQANKFFTPASNTKIFSCYAGMKYLGDSLTGLLYTETDQDIYIVPTGDPSLLHADFKNQPVISFLQHSARNIYVVNNRWQEPAWGAGWSWDDYNGDFMAERSALPVYGNTIRFVQSATADKQETFGTKPQATVYSIPDINWKINFSTDTGSSFSVRRKLAENIFTVTQGKEKYKTTDIPFVTGGISSALELLKDTIGREIRVAVQMPPAHSQLHAVHSQPADSVFTPMMHRSDNFFAEQTLLMVSNRLLGTMNDGKIIDTLLATDFKDLPQKPSWADGSGLSRFNLFTPQDFVWILNKMKQEFAWKRLSTIFATGNSGTLTGYYLTDSSFIYAKTGTLSGVVALSGYLVTKKNKTLIFSVLVNNHQSTGRLVRRSIEKFIQSIRDNY